MIYKLLRHFNINSKYKGYPLMIEAINIYIEHYGGYIQITKDVYPILAEKYNTTPYCVERNIRTIVELCWKNKRQSVKEIIGHEITICPTNSDFLDAVAYTIIYISKREDILNTYAQRFRQS